MITFHLRLKPLQVGGSVALKLVAEVGPPPGHRIALIDKCVTLAVARALVRKLSADVPGTHLQVEGLPLAE